MAMLTCEPDFWITLLQTDDGLTGEADPCPFVSGHTTVRAVLPRYLNTTQTRTQSVSGLAELSVC
jgi:hypothetical protein